MDNWDWEAGTPPDPPDEDAETISIEIEQVIQGFIVSGTKQITITVDTPVHDPDDGQPNAPAD